MEDFCREKKCNCAVFLLFFLMLVFVFITKLDKNGFSIGE